MVVFTMSQPRKRRQAQPSTALSSRSSYSYSRLSLALLTLALALSTFSTVSATITCALPAGGTYKAGDSIILDWGSDGTMPVVTDIASINGTLYCNSGTKIADVSIPNLTGPYNWTVPGVGNATIAGGTQGLCAMNAFHVEYSGEAWGFLNAIKSPFGPVRCGTITIMPAFNGTVTTTTTTMSSTTTTSSSSPTETSPSSDGSTSGGLSTVVIVVIAVVAAVLLTLSIVGLVWYLRKQKRRRLAAALGPWSLDSGSNRMHVNNAQHSRFSKVSTLMDHDLDDEPHGSPSASNNRPVMAAVGASAVTFGMKPQPTLPGIGPSNRSSRQSQQQQHQSYYGEIDFADYGYQLPQQQQLLNQGGFNNNGYHLPGYNADGNNGVYQHNNASNQSVGEDDFYNPYYAHRQSLQQQQQYQQSMQMMGMNQGNPSFYSQHSTGSNANGAGGVPPPPPVPPLGARPYSQDVRYSQVPDTQFQAGAQAQQGGYFPPPPPKSNARGGTAPETGGITSLQSGSTLSLSSSPKRGPQGANVMSEMGSREAAVDGGGGEKVLVQEEEEVKMEDVKKEDIRKEEVKSDDEDMETTPLTTTTTTVSSSTVDVDEKVKEA